MSKQTEIRGLSAIGLFAALAMFSTSLYGNVTWKTTITTGGDLAEPTNWTGDALPGSSDAVTIGTTQSGPLWLSSDVTATGGTRSEFKKSMTFALTNETGEAHTLTLGKLYCYGGSKTFKLTAGTLSLTSAYYIGDNPGSDNDTFIVDGVGTVFSGKAVSVGTGKSYSSFVVTNGASMTGTTIQVGLSSGSNGLFRVSGANTTASFSTAVQFGSASGNRIEVLDGACLATTNLYVRRNTTYAAANSWEEPCMLLVSGAGSKMAVNGEQAKGVYLGNPEGPGSTIVIENGAVFESRGEFSITGSNATMRVCSGATLTHEVYQLYVGNGAAAYRPSLTVDNATVLGKNGIAVRGVDGVLSVVNGGSVTSSSIITVGDKGTNDTLRVAGASSRVSVATTLDLKSEGVLAVEIPAGAIDGRTTPVTCKTLTLDPASKMSISIDPAMQESGRIVLVEATNNITVPEGFTFELPTAADFPRGTVTLDRTNAKQIAVNVKMNGNGMVIFVR